MKPSDWIAIAGIASGLVVFATGLYQYWRAQKWKRAEFVAAQMRAFERDPEIAAALQMLDWNSRTYDLPGSDSGSAPVEINDGILTSALLHHAAKSGGFSPAEVLVRGCFDELLDQLERFEHYVEVGLVSTSDLRPYLDYWLEILADRQSGRKPSAFYDSLDSYLKGYHYTGAVRLIGRFRE